MKYHQRISGVNYTFDGLVDLMAKATPLRSGDELAGCAAHSDAERAAAAWALAELPLDTFLNDAVVASFGGRLDHWISFRCTHGPYRPDRTVRHRIECPTPGPHQGTRAGHTRVNTVLASAVAHRGRRGPRWAAV